MKRVLCGLLLGATAFASAPAHATTKVVTVTPTVNDDTIGVGVTYGQYDEPLGGAYYKRHTNTVCAGLSYQLPFCVSVPVQ